MRMLQRAAQGVRVLAGALLFAGAVAGISPVSAAAAGPVAVRPGAAVGFIAKGILSGVAASSARDVWAVGQAPIGQALIVHWNGTAWHRVPAARHGRLGFLTNVAAISARNAWAVGFTRAGTGTGSLIEHWNGTVWRRVPGAAQASTVLSDVAGTGARNAWAVGWTNTKAARPVIEHWSGTAWQRVASPDPAGGGFLVSVAATSPRNAWAVGFTGGGGPLIERWNGTAWQRVPGPRPGRHSLLVDVAATSPRSAWAVGFTGTLTSRTGKTLIMRWNGTAWRRVPSPASVGSRFLVGVAATSARSAWAVGFTGSVPSPKRSLIERWDGTAWQRVPSPAPASTVLSDVAVISERSAWAVGYTKAGNGDTVIMRWNGTTWKAGASP
jgi:hypothetical protein